MIVHLYFQKTGSMYNLRNLKRNPYKVTKQKIKPSDTKYSKPKKTKTKSYPYSPYKATDVKRQYKRYETKPHTSEYPHTDMSYDTLYSLWEDGYNRVTFVTHSGACPKCRKRNGATWWLTSILRYYADHKAPIFAVSHVNSLSAFKVWDSKGILPPVYVDWTGSIQNHL